MVTSNSSIISALGGGSGVDMSALAADLAAARFQFQVNQLERRSEALEAKLSAASLLKSQLSELASALGERIRTGDLATSATIGNADVAQVSVLASSNGTGSYSLEVERLASRQIIASKPFGMAASPVGEGQLTIRFGTFDGDILQESSGQAVVTLDIAATDSLTTVAQKINATAASVTAYVVNSADGTRLVMKGHEGAGSGFVVEANGTGELGNLAWDPVTDAGQRTSIAGDAELRFDGVPMLSASNSVTGLPGGLSLTLTGTNAGNPTTIGFADKNSAITALMTDFVAALNDIASSLSDLAAPLGGELGNDAGARNLRRSLSALGSTVIMPHAGDGEPATLSDLGLKLNRDGTFGLDNARLQNAISTQGAAVGAMFTSGLYGVFATMDDMARSFSLAADPGSLGGSLSRYSAQQKKLDDKIAGIAEQQEKLREQMVKSFAWADQKVTSSQSTLSFIKSQIAIGNSSDD